MAFGCRAAAGLAAGVPITIPAPNLGSPVMTDTITSIQQAGNETERYARSLGAEIYAVASAALYEE